MVSRNVSENPSVRFNYFQEQIDLDTCVQGTRTILQATTTNGFQALMYTDDTVPPELRPVKLAIDSTWPPRDLYNETHDTLNIQQWCKDSLTTIWHYHGGCVVGQVVDRDYRVLGVGALRVIDGSTFRRSPGTNPQATVMMLGR